MLYVDNVRIPFGRMKMCHLTADTQDELRVVAIELGLERHLQYMGTYKFHLDVSLTKKQETLTKYNDKIKQVTMVEMGRLLATRRVAWS